MKAEDLTGDASIRKGKAEVLVQLVGDEREAVVSDVADADERKMKIETAKFTKNKIWNEEIKNEDTIIHNGCMKLKGGVLRTIETREYFFWDAKKVVIVRTDTGEIVSERPIKPEETFQDFTEPEAQVKPEDIPEEFKRRLIAFVPNPDQIALPSPVETDCQVVDDAGPVHLCASCKKVDEQPRCRDGLITGESITFIADDPEAEIIHCANFEPFPSEGAETNATEPTGNEPEFGKSDMPKRKTKNKKARRK